mgnify:CR=1 FL=1
MDKLKVSIGIPAYGAERRIQQLLYAVLNQTAENYVFHELIVHIDEFPDATRQKIEELNDPHIKIVETMPRSGYAHALQRLFEASTGDVLITFNDDIKIEDSNLVEKLTAPFRNNNVGIVTGRPVPFPPKTFIEKAVTSAEKIYNVAKYESGNCNTANTTDGKTMSFSRAFIEKFKFPENLGIMGCVDSYLYFSARKLGFDYIHVKDAVVYGTNSSTVKDYIKFHIRVFAHSMNMKKLFPIETAKEQNFLSKRTIIRETAKEVFRNPFGLAAIFLLNRYAKKKARELSAQQFNATWDIVATSKNV